MESNKKEVKKDTEEDKYQSINDVTDSLVIAFFLAIFIKAALWIYNNVKL